MPVELDLAVHIVPMGSAIATMMVDPLVDVATVTLTVHLGLVLLSRVFSKKRWRKAG